MCSGSCAAVCASRFVCRRRWSWETTPTKNKTKERANAEVARREAFERSRGTLRLCMRAWREQADTRLPTRTRVWRAHPDGRREGADAWAEKWERACTDRAAELEQRQDEGGLTAAELGELALLERHIAALGGGQHHGAGGAGPSSARGGDCALARRVDISAGALRLWTDAGWRVRWILEWYRLVRAGTVLARRARLPRRAPPPPRDRAPGAPGASDGESDGDEADGHAAAARGHRMRKTDAVLALGRAARGGLTRQLAGRIAHARRARGDG